MRFTKKQIALLVTAALFAVASISMLTEGKFAECLTGVAIAAVLAWLAMRTQKNEEVAGEVDYDSALAVVDVVSESLEASSGSGIDTSLALSTLVGGRPDVSGAPDRGRLSVGGGGNESPLLVAKLDGHSVNVRFWVKKGAPTWEYDYDRDAKTISAR